MKNEVVHCKTQEEWDFVCSKIKNSPSKYLFYDSDFENNKGNCIQLNTNSPCFCWKNYYVTNENYTIYSFKEWYNKFNHTFKLDQQENNITIEELPKKWFLNVTKENLDIVNNWLGEHSFNLGDWSCVHYNKSASDKGNQPKDYKEITLEQFKKITNYSPIITKKEEIMEEKWKVGGWVKSLRDYGRDIKKEGIYQIERPESNRHVYLNVPNEGAKMLYKDEECEWIGMNKPNSETPSINNINMEQSKFKSWCVKGTTENKQILLEWLREQPHNFGFVTNSYYGWNKDGKFTYHSYFSGYNWKSIFDKLLTTEEFYIEIGKGIVKELPKEEENLIGRWYKTSPFKEKFNNQEYIQVVKVKNGNAYFNYTTQHIVINCWTNSLMPIGFNPQTSENLPIIDKIPEYVKRIGNIGGGGFGTWENHYEKGRIYNTKEPFPFCIANNWEECLTKQWYLHNFKPSTKKAYENQFKQQLLTTTINKKPDISSTIQVGNDTTTNIVIPNNTSVRIESTENEVNIKINLKQTIKI